MQRTVYPWILFVCLIVSGCGGHNESYLPRPRPAESDSPAPARAAAPSRPDSTAASPEPPSDSALPAPSDLPVRSTAAAPDTPSPAPAEPSASKAEFSGLEGRPRAVEHLTRIGVALEAYRKEHGRYPNRSMFAGGLSWRVALLQHLGQSALPMDRDEPWNHPANRALLTRIPDVFKSGVPGPGKTNLVLITGTDTAWATGRGLSAEECPDGLENTILVVEAGSTHAVPWTAPEDCEFSRETAQEALFGTHQDCCYALFGGSTGVRRIPATISDEHLLALLTPAGGEAVSALDVTRPPTPEPDVELLQYLKEHPVVRFAQRETPAPPSATAAGAPLGSDSLAKQAPEVSPGTSAMVQAKEAEPASAPASQEQAARLPIPDEVSQQLARRILREAHHEEYAAARTDERKRELAEKLLARARTPESDPASRYVALELSRKIAIEAGDVPRALESVDLLTQAFQTESLAERAEVLVSSVGRALSESDNELVLSEARKWLEQALERDEFDLADQSLNAALSAARRLRDTKLIGTLTERKKEIANARAARAEVADYIDLVLQHPTHPEANQIVGSYYCLVKQRWEDGLPLLARAADPRLAELAALELKPPDTPSEQLALADRWWMYAEGEAKHKLALRARAAYWYRQALSGLPPGLERIKAETRLAKAESKERGEPVTATP